VPVAARWRLRVLDFDGTPRAERSGAVTLAPLASTPLADDSDAQLLGGADPRRSVAVYELVVGGKPVSRSLVLFGQAKDLALPRPAIAAELAPAGAGQGYRLTLRSPVLARLVWVSFGELDAELSDNSVDLLPGEPVTIQVRSKASLAALRKALALQDLADAMAGAEASR
jgi:beta-mannosidase